MIFHLSIAADDPARVASVIAELWGGESFPFPPFPGSFTAMAGDDRNSAIEVYPRGLELRPASGRRDVEAAFDAAPRRFGATHAAIATPLTEQQVHDLAAREGWTAKTLSRGGVFGVIEFWLENSTMLEVLTEEMQADYLNRVTIDGWRAMLEQGHPGPPPGQQ